MLPKSALCTGCFQWEWLIIYLIKPKYCDWLQMLYCNFPTQSPDKLSLIKFIVTTFIDSFAISLYILYFPILYFLILYFPVLYIPILYCKCKLKRACRTWFYSHWHSISLVDRCRVQIKSRESNLAWPVTNAPEVTTLNRLFLMRIAHNPFD